MLVKNWEFYIWSFRQQGEKDSGLGMGIWSLKTHLHWQSLQQGYVYYSFQIMPIPGAQAFKSMSLWGPFLFKPPHHYMDYFGHGHYTFKNWVQLFSCICRSFFITSLSSSFLFLTGLFTLSSRPSVSVSHDSHMFFWPFDYLDNFFKNL